MHSTDTIGGRTPATLRITMDPTATCGVSLGMGRDILPGETADVPYTIAVTQLRAGRARLAADVPAAVAAPVAPSASASPASPVAVESRDPAPAARRKR